MKWILVTGTARPFEREAVRRARLTGAALARSGFGLVTGNFTGVDAAAATAFAGEHERSGHSIEACYRQLIYPTWTRRSFWLGRRFNCNPKLRRAVRDDKSDVEAAVSFCDAAIMIGGRGGSVSEARVFMDSGKPVFPVPFSGGRSDELFQELLRDWHDNPIPGLSRTQTLRLALPWTSGPSALIDLLSGTLCTAPEIFISYRRTDSGSAVGRLHRDLADYFGNKRIFVDETRIQPSADWKKSIDEALLSCKIGLIVIGKNWLDGRLAADNDVLRHEVSYLLNNRVAIPLLVDDAGVPSSSDLPDDINRLPSIQARSISNSNWDVVMQELIRTIDSVLKMPSPA